MGRERWSGGISEVYKILKYISSRYHVSKKSKIYSNHHCQWWAGALLQKKNTLAAITVGGRGNFWERNHLTRQGTYHVRMAIPCTYRIYKLTKFIKNLKNHTYSFDPPLFFVYKFQLRNLSNE
jgi:hypothetical protein